MDMLAALSGAFLAVLFLQSGLDRVLDRARYVAHFVESNSRGPLRKWPRATLNLLTLLEVLAGATSTAGVLLWFLGGKNPMLLAGALFSSLALLALFALQRLNQDERAAARVVPYFLVALLALHLNVS
jgi:hypothetical protein